MKKIADISLNYLQRSIDQRMVAIIENHIPFSNTILDLACGSGLYGEFLAKKTKRLLGFDYDRILCENTRSSGYYTEVFCDTITNLNQYAIEANTIFCSEFLEHLSNQQIRPVLESIEAICTDKLVITVPNPLSPHFRQDPTHILNYNIYSFLKLLNSSSRFHYKLYPLGFSQLNLQKRIFRVLNPLASRVAILSPTVLYIGQRTKS